MRRAAIRVDADELTYPVHIMLRYELEKRIFDGKLRVRDLPAAWSEGLDERLGLRPASDGGGEGASGPVTATALKTLCIYQTTFSSAQPPLS